MADKSSSDKSNWPNSLPGLFRISNQRRFSADNTVKFKANLETRKSALIVYFRGIFGPYFSDCFTTYDDRHVDSGKGLKFSTTFQWSKFH